MKSNVNHLQNFQNHPMWCVFEERFKRIESKLLAQKAVLTFNEAAEYSGLSKSFLYKLTSTGKVPHFKPNGKNIFFDRIEFEAWLKRNPVKTQEEIDKAASRYVTINKGGKP